MLTTYKPPVEEDSSKAEYRKIIPIGKPYLTKVNGRLVFARDKRKKSSKLSLSLLGEVFGYTTKVVRKRSKSVEKPPKSPIVIGGIAYVPQAQQIPYSTPLPQQPFSTPAVPVFYVPYPPYALHPAPQEPQSVVVPATAGAPTRKELKQLTKIDADFKAKTNTGANEETEITVSPRAEEVKTTITIIKHICANCGRLRSRRYHDENPIKLGEIPLPTFCGKCQRDASSTSCLESEMEVVKKKKARKLGKSKKRDKKDESVVESASEDKDRSSGPAEASSAKVLGKPKRTKSTKKGSKDASLEEPIVVEEAPILKENQAPSGRTRGKQGRQEGAESELSPAPPVRPSKKSAQFCTRSQQVEIEGETDDLPPTPPKIRASNREYLHQHPLPLQCQMFEAIPVYHASWREYDHGRGMPMHFIDRRSADESEHRSFRRDHVATHGRLPPQPLYSGRYYDSGPEMAQINTHRSYYSEEYRPHSRSQPSYPSFEDRDSYSGSSSSQMRDLDEPRASSRRSASSVEPTLKFDKVEPGKRNSEDYDFKRSNTIYDYGDLSKEQKPTRLSRSETSHNVNQRPPSFKMSSPAPEYLVNMREAVFEPISSDSHASRGSSRLCSLKGFKTSESVQSSRSNSSQNVLQRYVSSNHSAFNTRRCVVVVGSQKTSSEGHVSRDLSGNHASRDFSSRAHRSTSSVAEASSHSDTTERLRRRGRKSPLSDLGSAWDQPGSASIHMQNVETSRPEHNVDEQRDHEQRYHEQRDQRSEHHDDGAELNQHSFAANQEQSFSSSWKSKKTSSGTEKVFDAWSHNTEHDFDKVSAPDNIEVQHNNEFASQDEEAVKSSRHGKSRHRRRYERISPSVDAKSSWEIAPLQSNKESEKSAEPSEQSSYRVHEFHEPEHKIVPIPQQARDLEADEIEIEVEFSAADAAKYYKDDWSNGDTRGQDRESKRRSDTTSSDVSFPAPDASRYYQEDWGKKDLLNESMETLPHRSADHQELDLTASEISRYCKGSKSDVLPGAPSPPSHFGEKGSEQGVTDTATQVSPSNRRCLNSSHKGKELRAPSTIWEASEGQQSRSPSQNSSRLGEKILSTELSFIHNNPSPHSQESSQSGHGEVEEEGSDSSDSESVSMSEPKTKLEKHAEQLKQDEEIVAIEAEAEVPAQALGVPDSNGWYTVTESTLEMIARQEAVPGFGGGVAEGDWNSDGGSSGER